MLPHEGTVNVKSFLREKENNGSVDDIADDDDLFCANNIEETMVQTLTRKAVKQTKKYLISIFILFKF